MHFMSSLFLHKKFRQNYFLLPMYNLVSVGNNECLSNWITEDGLDVLKLSIYEWQKLWSFFEVGVVGESELDLKVTAVSKIHNCKCIFLKFLSIRVQTVVVTGLQLLHTHRHTHTHSLSLSLIQNAVCEIGMREIIGTFKTLALTFFSEAFYCSISNLSWWWPST